MINILLISNFSKVKNINKYKILMNNKVYFIKDKNFRIKN